MMARPVTHVRVVRMHGREPVSVRQVPLLRACALCVHTSGQQTAADLQCRCPAFVGQRSTMPCHVARAAAGPCGPNAQHLDMLSWRQATRPPARATA